MIQTIQSYGVAGKAGLPCVRHFSLSFADPMPQPWGHGAAASISCGEGSDDRPSSPNRDGSIRAGKCTIQCLQTSGGLLGPAEKRTFSKAFESRQRKHWR